MNSHQLRIVATILMVLVIALSAGSALAAGQNEMKAGKKSQIVLSKSAKVGDVTLPAGRYTFQHVVSAGQHIARFTGPEETNSKSVTEVKCTNESLNQKVAQTSVRVENVDGVDRVTRIEIAGETVAHVL